MCYTILDIVMRKLYLVLSVLATAILIFHFSSCSSSKDKSCDCCQSFKSVEKTLLDSNGNPVVIKIPTAFTPTNYAFCDSNTYDASGNLVYTGCRKNVDAVYNDNLNNSFKIIGIEKFKGNSLIIKTLTDTTPLAQYSNYQLPDRLGNLDEGFVGITIDHTLYGSERQRLVVSGRYQYILQIYNSRKKHDLTTRIDSISGFFCIIRNASFCNIGCQGVDAGDKLMK